MSSRTWKHDELASDLAGYLRGYSKPTMVWENMQLGPVGSPRPDVYTLDPTYMRIAARAFEVKVTRSDFLRDVQAGKALGYRCYAGSLVFATPKGLVKKDEVPAGCGLIERGAENWRWARKPVLQSLDDLPFECWMKLLIDGIGREQGSVRRPESRSYHQWMHDKRVRERLGAELGELYANRERARGRLVDECRRLNEQAEETKALRLEREKMDRERAEQQLEAIRSQIRALCVEFGLDETAPAWEVARALRSLRPDDDRSHLESTAQILERQAQQMQRAAIDLRNRLGAAA